MMIYYNVCFSPSKGLCFCTSRFCFLFRSDWSENESTSSWKASSLSIWFKDLVCGCLSFSSFLGNDLYHCFGVVL